MQIGDYTLANKDKVDRAINGTVLDRGQAKGGVGAEADEADVLAEYDRLGGLILKGSYKVKTGSFYDFKAKAPIKKPKPVLVFVVNGEIVEVDADEPLPLEVRASEQAKTKKQERAEAAAAKKQAAADKKAAAKAAKKAGKEKPEEDENDTDEDDGELA
jgi:hypothetical protein